MFEIFYSDGGYWGKFKTLSEAIGEACILVNAIKKDGLYADIREYGCFANQKAMISRLNESDVKVEIF